MLDVAAASRSPLNNSEISQVKNMVRQSLLFFNDALRDPNTGQYLDAISLQEGSSRENNSSVAATGMGLVSLAIGDATGDLEQAHLKAVKTLSMLLDPSYSRRSTQGWFRHWFNSHDGSDNSMSRADGYSTIDTAILVAGSLLAANYFSDRNKDPQNALNLLTNELLHSVNWASAISDATLGNLYLNFSLEHEIPLASTKKFNEYVLVACMGKLAEENKGKLGPMKQFWDRHFARTDFLPKKTFRGQANPIQLLTDSPTHFLSSFTIQFAYYLCGDFNSNQNYIRYFKNAMKADRAWFRQQKGSRAAYWGNGAGEALNGRYAANAIDKNPDLISSPHIVAGFIPAAPEVVRDLLTMQRERHCIFSHGEYEFLWRCTPRNFSVRLNRLQAIDFSSLFLGLAVLHPLIPQDFYQRYSP
jgi:hypothetical protein